MHDHHWPKLILLVAALFFVFGAAWPERTLAASPKKLCKRCCKLTKKECVNESKIDFRTAKAACKEAVEPKTCKAGARVVFRAAKKACKDAFETCKGECAVGSLEDPNTCPPNQAGGPNLLTMTVSDGADLDAGWTGVGHNQGVVVGAKLQACLQDCDTGTDPVCTGVGPIGLCSLNGKTYGPPLPLLAADVATCVINEFTEDVTIREVNLQTGEIDMRVKLNAVVHLTGDKRNPCPTCSGESIGAEGRCRGLTGALGKKCTTEGTTEKFGNTSSDCLPFRADNAGELEIVLDPVTSGTVTREAEISCSGGLCLCSGGGNPPSMNECDEPFSCSEEVCTENGGSDDVRKGIQPGVDQQCCEKGRDIIPCFTNVISRTGEAVPGEPLWPDPVYPKTVDGGKVAGVFCIPPTNSSVINQPTGLGGPGAFILPGSVRVEYTN